MIVNCTYYLLDIVPTVLVELVEAAVPQLLGVATELRVSLPGGDLGVERQTEVREDFTITVVVGPLP